MHHHHLTAQTSFFMVGVIFGGLYLIGMNVVVWNIKERKVERGTSIPLVPSMLRSFKNIAFRPLLLGWILDAVALATLASTFPFFIIYVIKPNPDVISAKATQAACFAALFIGAIISMPIWKFLASKFGRYRVWMAFNLTAALTNAGYAFVGEGDPLSTIGLTFINGLPLGGQFLTDSILADVIDYDEFLNGSRNEGGFTVFASFIPKFVAVPSGALPLAAMAMIGFVASGTFFFFILLCVVVVPPPVFTCVAAFFPWLVFVRQMRTGTRPRSRRRWDTLSGSCLWWSRWPAPWPPSLPSASTRSRRRRRWRNWPTGSSCTSRASPPATPSPAS